MRRPGGGSSWQSQPVRRHPAAEWKPHPRTDGGGIPAGPETASRSKRRGREWSGTPVRSTTRRLDPPPGPGSERCGWARVRSTQLDTDWFPPATNGTRRHPPHALAPTSIRAGVQWNWPEQWTQFHLAKAEKQLVTYGYRKLSRANWGILPSSVGGVATAAGTSTLNLPIVHISSLFLGPIANDSGEIRAVHERVYALVYSSP